MAYVNKPRNYKREYELYQGTPEQIKKRGLRNKARALLEKAGKVHDGDGMDVDHKLPLSKGGTDALTNLRVKTKHANRSFARNKDRSIKKA